MRSVQMYATSLAGNGMQRRDSEDGDKITELIWLAAHFA